MSQRSSGKTKFVFQDLLSREITPWMESRMYSRKGQTFAKWAANTCSSIRFQTSRWSNPSLYEFTVNVGVFSAIIYKFEYEPSNVPKYPNEAYCHWRARLGELAPVGKDVWWSFSDAPEADHAWTEIARLLDTYALPVLRDRATDEGFRDFLLQQWERYPDSLGIMQNLVVVLRELGPEERFREVLEGYRKAIVAKPTATLAVARLEKLAGKREQSIGERD
ncbi:MAG TPA: DUF4304 domain-containing protein [Thermoplasmata archaeon]|nr:DUF4304 domain-containing protein [Thermoplasmata archaeon]